MENVLFSQKYYSDVVQKQLYSSLLAAFNADDDGKKEKLSALCMGEIQYLSNGAKKLLEYAVPQRAEVLASSFRKALTNRDIQTKNCRGIFADNLMFVARNEDAILLDAPSLDYASKYLLENKENFNRISIIKAKFSVNGFEVDLNSSIQFFKYPYYLKTYQDIVYNCRPEVIKIAQKYYNAGYDLFGCSSEDGDELSVLVGDCCVLEKEIFEAWASLRAPIQRMDIPEQVLMWFPPNGGWLN